MASTSPYRTASQPASRETSSDESEATEDDGLDPNYVPVGAMRRWNAINRPQNLRQNTEHGMFAGTTKGSPRGTNNSMSAQYQARVSGSTPATLERSEQAMYNIEDVAGGMSLVGHALSGRPRLSMQNSVRDVSTPSALHSQSARQNYPAFSQGQSYMFPLRTSAPAGGQGAIARAVFGVPTALGYGSNGHVATNLPPKGLECLTPKSWDFLDSDMRLPTSEICQEYVDIVNIISSTDPLIADHDRMTAQRRSDMATLKNGIEKADAIAAGEESEINKEHVMANPAPISRSDYAGNKAYIAALDTAREQANVVEEKIQQVKDKLAWETEPLRRQIAGLEEDMKKAKEGAAPAINEREVAKGRKSEIEKTWGQGLFYLLGKETGMGLKRKRGE